MERRRRWSVQTISLLEGARLELEGAQLRLARAIQALQDFDAEFAGRTVGNGLARALAHEREALATELGAATWRHKECAVQLADLKNSEVQKRRS